MKKVSNQLQNMDLNEKFEKISRDIEHETNEKIIFEYVTSIRKILSIEVNPPIQDVIDANLVPKLVKFLDEQYQDNLIFESVWALTNICSGSLNHTQAVVDAGACTKFMKLLNSSNDDVLEQCIWALGNIAGDSVKQRSFLLEMGIVDHLIEIYKRLDKLKLTTVRNLIWATSNLTRGKPSPLLSSVSPFIPYFKGLFKFNDEEVLTDLLWSISYISDGPNDRIQCIIDAGLVPDIVPFLYSGKPLLITPALRSIGNIVTGDDSQTEVVIQNGGLKAICKLLTHSKKGISKEACWTISNITAGNHEQIQYVIDEDIIPILVSMSKKEEFDVKKEAIWAISNATSGGSLNQIQYMIKCGIIEMFLIPHKDPTIISICLEGIENILKLSKGTIQEEIINQIEEVGGIEYIESLQNHTNQDIYEKALNIIETYFENEAEKEITENQ